MAAWEKVADVGGADGGSRSGVADRWPRLVLAAGVAVLSLALAVASPAVAAATAFGASSCCGSTFGLKNTGTITLAAGAGTVAADGLPFNNAGKLVLSSGTLQLGQFEQTAGTMMLVGGSVADAAATLLIAGGVRRRSRQAGSTPSLGRRSPHCATAHTLASSQH